MFQLSPTQWYFVASTFMFVFMVLFVAWASPANRRAERAGNNLSYAVFSSIMTVGLCGALLVWSLNVGDMWFSVAVFVNVLTAVYITSMNWYNYLVSSRLACIAGPRG
jgi:hypothetical protein